MDELFQAVVSWRDLVFLLVVFGFAPGFVLRLLVRLYPKDDPRRTELVAELYALDRCKRPFFVTEQIETVLFEGLPHRVAALRQRLTRTTAGVSPDSNPDHLARLLTLKRRVARMCVIARVSMVGTVLWITSNAVYVFLTDGTVATWINVVVGAIIGIVTAVLFLAARHVERQVRPPSSGIAPSRKS